MEHSEYPDSPKDAIDPRWTSYLHAESAAGASGKQHGDPAAPLGDAMREIIDPWQAGLRSTRETLEALRALADRVL
jgi:hypothetical protein